ncbi:MAG: putative sugar O-methyltransferase [Anaerolineae bacterium]
MSIRNAVALSLNYRRRRLDGWARRLLGRTPSPDLETYFLMRQDNQTADAKYQAGKFWQGINNEFEDFLWAGALTNLRNEYFNRRFAGPEPASRQVWRALLWLYYQHLQTIDTDGFLKTAVEPSAGGTSDQEIIDGRPMSLDFLQSVEEVYRIREAWALAGETGSPSVIVELGGGYGRLAYVCRKMLPECTYVILDLPEALICANSWLNRVLPGECVAYADARRRTTLDREQLQSGKVWLLGAHQIEAIASKSIDAFVNIYSFAEMPRQAIDNYFAQIDRITQGSLYSKQRKLEDNRIDGVKVSSDIYPIPQHWRLLFHRTSSLYEAFFEAGYGTA